MLEDSSDNLAQSIAKQQQLNTNNQTTDNKFTVSSFH